jgi:hypothetical protein
MGGSYSWDSKQEVAGKARGQDLTGERANRKQKRNQKGNKWAFLTTDRERPYHGRVHLAVVGVNSGDEGAEGKGVRGPHRGGGDDEAGCAVCGNAGEASGVS